ncbi:hypothetical protein DRP07_00380 [Archaeoglobales archaeon]|nr:MAG: hypothetical protein DRP07_00380 [Archaeoglobales archaeon]
MVYHLKYHYILRDIFATDESLAGYLIEESLKELNLKINKANIKSLIRTCKNTTSKEGFEICINQFREDLSEEFWGGRAPESFEKFLKSIDEAAEGILLSSYEKHTL